MAFKGSEADGDRALQLEKLREEQKIDFEKRKQQLQRDNDGGLKSMDEAFKSQDTRAEDHFKTNTIGLVSAEEWKQRRIEAETMAKAEEEIKKRLRRKNKRKKDKERKKNLQKLSFVDDDEEAAEEVIPIIKKKKKDPTVQTHFLPDKDREEEENRMKEKLRKEWEEQQEIIKKEKIQVTYSYWDGSGHRRSIEIEKGTKIEHFLELCRRALVDSFHELRGMSSESLMYIKEDLIIPQHYTFYDLIISKARGKSGPLFHFDVHDDIRLQADARIEKDESHAGKIVTRAYYERNKHVFPVSRWEVYDPSKSYDKYTIR